MIYIWVGEGGLLCEHAMGELESAFRLKKRKGFHLVETAVKKEWNSRAATYEKMKLAGPGAPEEHEGYGGISLKIVCMGKVPVLRSRGIYADVHQIVQRSLTHEN